MPEWVSLAQAQANGLLHQPVMMNVSMMNPTTCGLSIASLVFGIVGVISCFGIFGIPAVIMGHMAMSQIANSPVPMVGRGMAIAGLICGYVGILITVGIVTATLIPILSLRHP